jgi:hypothetical protein
MRFFNRRGRSRSVDRNANKNKRGEAHAAHKNDKKQGSDDSVGSELPTVDQFEIAVPSRSFASASVGHDRFHDESREDDALDNRSCTDISSITSVSYRAGYYYLRNIKNKKAPEKKVKQSGCVPSCSCSWLTCCCCAEAKSEIATDAATTNAPTSAKNSLIAQKSRKYHTSAGRKAKMAARGRPPQTGLGYPPQNVHRGSASRGRYNARESILRDPADRPQPPIPIQNDERMMYPVLKRNHSLFDELSEEEELPVYGQKRRPQQQVKSRKNKSKAWLMRASGVGGQDYYGNNRDRPRSRSRGRNSRGRVERY